MWKIVITMDGDDPSEQEVEKAEEAVQNALDAAAVDYMDITSM